MSESIGGETIMNTALKVLERKLEGSWKKIGDGVYVKAFNAWRVDSPKKYLLYAGIEPLLVPKDLTVELKLDLKYEQAYSRLVSGDINMKQTSWSYELLDWVVDVAEGIDYTPADDFMSHLELVRDAGGFKIYRVARSFSCVLFLLSENTAVIDVGDEYIIAPSWALDLKTREEVLHLFYSLQLNREVFDVIYFSSERKVDNKKFAKNREVLNALAESVSATDTFARVREEADALVLELKGSDVKIARATRVGGAVIALKNGAELRVFNYADVGDAVAVVKAQSEERFELSEMAFHEVREVPGGVEVLFVWRW